MSGHACGVDTSLPESFLQERMMFNKQQASRSYNIPKPKSFGTLIDFYKDPSMVNMSCSSYIWSSEERDDFQIEKKKSSSLKTTSNNTGEKKIVRFADVLGLDLADVHTFLDEIPRIPKSAFKDLKNVDVAPPSPPKSTKTLVPMFVQPASHYGFIEKLTKNKVCLENTFVTNTISLNVRGTVRVVNIDFEKLVKIRYSIDKWKTHSDITCQYLESSSDGFSDRFSFTIPASPLLIGQRLEFAVNYKITCGDFWDNNGGANYIFQCVPDSPPKPVTTAYVPSTLALESWGSFY